jgi:NADH-quinone oxidoreductase subunit C
MEEKLREICNAFQATFENLTDSRFRISSGVESLFGLLDILFREKLFWCDYLNCMSAEHITGTAEFIVLHYHLESIPNRISVHISCRQELESSDSVPVFPSVTSLWHTAGWHEREAAELFGIRFENHPDLRKLLLPADWEGYPMRKNYQPSDSYHGLKIIVKEEKGS